MFPTANPKVIASAKKIQAHAPIFIDTETTGTRQSDVVIEVGVVDQTGGVLYESLVRPGMPIPPDSSAVHGITDAMVADAPTWKDIWPELSAVLEGRLVGMYNEEFDVRLMKQTHQRYWMDWSLNQKHTFCVMRLYAAFYGAINQKGNGYRLHKLESAGADAGIPLPNSHRAVDDARLTAALFSYIANYEKESK
jgi:DNA polymerase-3 subunit epsilon